MPGQRTEWAGWQGGDTLTVVDLEGVLQDLMHVAESVGLEVHHRALRGTHPSHGGFCRLPGRTVVFLSSKATPLECCAVLAQALAELGHAAHPALRNESRALVERKGRPASTMTTPRVPPAPATTTAARPGLACRGSEGRRRL